MTLFNLLIKQRLFFLARLLFGLHSSKLVTPRSNTGFAGLTN
jgi:hypothetical protein